MALPTHRSPLFPSRRSSDLPDHDEHKRRRGELADVNGQRQVEKVDEEPRADRGKNAVVEDAGDEGDRPHVKTEGTAVADLQKLRSEEHTSELQSPYDLVCRL